MPADHHSMLVVTPVGRNYVLDGRARVYRQVAQSFWLTDLRVYIVVFAPHGLDRYAPAAVPTIRWYCPTILKFVMTTLLPYCPASSYNPGVWTYCPDALKYGLGVLPYGRCPAVSGFLDI